MHVGMYVCMHACMKSESIPCVFGHRVSNIDENETKRNETDSTPLLWNQKGISVRGKMYPLRYLPFKTAFLLARTRVLPLLLFTEGTPGRGLVGGSMGLGRFGDFFFSVLSRRCFR